MDVATTLKIVGFGIGVFGFFMLLNSKHDNDVVEEPEAIRELDTSITSGNNSSVGDAGALSLDANVSQALVPHPSRGPNLIGPYFVLPHPSIGPYFIGPYPLVLHPVNGPYLIGPYLILPHPTNCPYLIGPYLILPHPTNCPYLIAPPSTPAAPIDRAMEILYKLEREMPLLHYDVEIAIVALGDVHGILASLVDIHDILDTRQNQENGFQREVIRMLQAIMDKCNWGIGMTVACTLVQLFLGGVGYRKVSKLINAFLNSKIGRLISKLL